MQAGGVGAGLEAVAADGVLADPHEAGGLADAAALVQVGEDGGRRRGWQTGVEQRRPFPLGEAGHAGGAAEQASAVAAVAHGHGQIPVVAFRIIGAVPVQAAEAAEVIVGRRRLAHGGPSPEGVLTSDR